MHDYYVVDVNILPKNQLCGTHVRSGDLFYKANEKLNDVQLLDKSTNSKYKNGPCTPKR